MSKQITISSVLQDLEQGLTRLEIQEKYELSNPQMKKLFQNVHLKGKRAKADIGLDIVDDVTITNQTNLLDEIEFLKSSLQPETQQN